VDGSSLEQDTLTLLKTLGYPGDGLIFEFRIHKAETMTKATLNAFIKLMKKPNFDAAKVCQCIKLQINLPLILRKIAHGLGRAAKVDEMLDIIGTTTLGMINFDVKKIKVDGEVRPCQ